MKRDLLRLAREEFDVLVVGGGIYGAFAAWDAASRGLSVALVEKGDFMSGTSSNSLKVLHGGLRYLQDFRLDLARRMVRERREMMRLAPHLVCPLPFVLPTRGVGRWSKPALWIALRMNDVLSTDRNHGLSEDLHIPRGKLLSKEELSQAFPFYSGPEDTSGAVVWHDGQIVDTERFGVSVLWSAYESGACLANYVEAKEIRRRNGTARGARVVDSFSGEEFDVLAKVVVNASGPWLNEVLSRSRINGVGSKLGRSLAINLVVNRLPHHDWALGLLADRPTDSKGGAGSVLFLVPWKGSSIIGTFHSEPVENRNGNHVNGRDQVQELLGMINAHIGSWKLTVEDVRMVHKGFLPCHPGKGRGDGFRLVRRGRVVDHRRDGLPGLISILGVKFTSARLMAEKAIDLAVQQVGVRANGCQTRSLNVYGGDMASAREYMRAKRNEYRGILESESVEELISTYGTRFSDVLAGSVPPGRPGDKSSLDVMELMKARVRFAVRSEMAMTLPDTVFRRVGICTQGSPSINDFTVCAEQMASELNWSEEETLTQVEEVMRQLHDRKVEVDT